MSDGFGVVRAIVVGGSGFLGRRISALLGPDSIATFRSQPVPRGVAFDATRERLHDLLTRLAAAGRAGFTHVFVPFGAVDLEHCARDYAATAAINVDAVCRVIEDAIAAGLIPVFVSTDYVFDGTRGAWREEDEPRPRVAYAAQKLEVERWLERRPPPWIVARLSKVVSGDTATHSMLGQWVQEIRAGKAMRCAEDQVFSPGFVDDLAGALIRLAEVGATGVFHAAGPEHFSRIGLLRLLAGEITKVNPSVRPDITPCSLHDLPFLEKRPLDTSLETVKLRAAIGPFAFKPMAVLCAETARQHFGRVPT